MRKLIEGICYIVAAGDVDAFRLEPLSTDLVIAADAGYLNLERLEVQANLVVGDFDSLGHRPDHPNVLAMPAEKDETDTLLAIQEGLSRGYVNFVIFGGLGGRLDHTLANIQTLSYLAAHGARGYLLGSGAAITVFTNGTLHFASGKSGTLSVFALNGPANGVTLTGLKYPLTDYKLTGSFPLGVSNAFTGDAAAVAVTGGTLTAVWDDTPQHVIASLKGSLL